MAEEFDNHDSMTSRAAGVVKRWDEGEKGDIQPAHGQPDVSNKDALDEEAAWGYSSRREPRWQAMIAVVVALVLYVQLPDKLILTPTRFVLPVLEAALIIPLLITARHRDGEQSWQQRWMALALIALINIANVISLGYLVNILLHGGKANGIQLIMSAAQIWATTVIVFGLWYWELDRGGPGARCKRQHREPDFLFPQMVTPEAAPKNWSPRFADYLYVSFTNATAFSPTDTMPMTQWAKLLMMVQAFTSLVTIALVAARAVNILH